jgi:DNA polymerase (family 10)
MEPAIIAAKLRELAVYQGLEGDRHRELAYERAARSIEAAGSAVSRLVEEDRLEELPGIGPAIARVVAELARRGTVSVLERLRRDWPPILVELADLPGVGVPRARALFQTLAPASIDALAAL